MRRYILAAFKRAVLTVVGFGAAMIVIVVAVLILVGLVGLFK